MSKVLFVLCSFAFFNGFSQGQTISSIEFHFENCLGFTCGSKANLKSGFNIQNDTTYMINRLISGKNNVVIDLVAKTMINDAIMDGKLYHEQTRIEDIRIKNDTLTFYRNAISRVSKVPYTEYFYIALKPKPTTVFSVNLWKNPRYGNIGGTILSDGLASMKINYSTSK